MIEQKWFSLKITVDIKAIEAIEFALNELESLGTEINNLGEQQSETVCVAGYFNEKPPTDKVENRIYEALKIYDFSVGAVKQTEWSEIENKDWLAEWKKHWKPTVTEKFIIAPTWEKIENTDKIVIRIEPSMAFGTGTHETTKLCLKAIEENFHSEMSFLDVGTGTGILAIAASKFKVQSSKFKVVGCDIDEDSIRIAVENAELNGVSEQIEFFFGSINESINEFDFVCANVTADVIIPMLEILLKKSRKFLVLSGILLEQESLVISHLKKLGSSEFKINKNGEWISVEIRGDA